MRKAITDLFLFLLGLTLAISIAELYLRYSLIDTSFHGQSNPRLFSYNSLQTDKLLGWKLIPNSVLADNQNFYPGSPTINSLGWREREFSPIKPKGSIRIAALGCSQTFGIGVKTEDTFSKVTEQLLTSQFQSSSFELLNFGVPGYGTDQMMLNYQEHIRHYSPDIVLIHLAEYHIFRNSRAELWGRNKPKFILKGGNLQLGQHSSDIYNPLRGFYLYKLIDLSLQNSENHNLKSALQDSKNIELTIRILRKLKEVAALNNTKILLWHGGSSLFSDNETLERIAASAGIQSVNIDKNELINRLKSEAVFMNPAPQWHWSPYAHNLIAGELYLALREFIHTEFI